MHDRMNFEFRLISFFICSLFYSLLFSQDSSLSCEGQAILNPEFQKIYIYTGYIDSLYIKKAIVPAYPKLWVKEDTSGYFTIRHEINQGYLKKSLEQRGPGKLTLEKRFYLIKIPVDTIIDKNYRASYLLVDKTYELDTLPISCGLQLHPKLIKLLSYKLTDEGYYTGSISENLNPDLFNCMMKYQYDHDIPVGLVSDALYDSLKITKHNIDSLLYTFNAKEWNYIPSLKADIDSLSNGDSILLYNPSFEQKPVIGGQPGFRLIGWNDCGSYNFPDENPVDILPHPDAIWQVIRPANHGSTYVGMSTRENNSWESVSQNLAVTLNQNDCYSISFALCQSDKFISGVKSNPNITVNFNAPTKLRIWGGIDFCHQQELLIETEPITSHNWETLEFMLKPSSAIKSLTFEAFYADKNKYRNGHILLDNISVIRKVKCEED